MSLRNKATLIGFTGKEVEIVNFENGIKASVSLATTDHYTNAQGEKVEETQWHNLVAYGKLAEIFQKYVTKGKEIAVEGKLTYRSYEDKEGKTRYITEIKVDEILLLSSGSQKPNQEG
ncbi:single-stranded DNA-binding protein [Elizabethkingia anophelis]|nr:single-stranded DNA-binding protein [Elizabethkingia anophelis]